MEDRESSSVRAVIPKFESGWSGGTIRSSENHTVAVLQSASRSAASAYAPRGVEPPVSTIWPPPLGDLGEPVGHRGPGIFDAP